MIRRQHGPHNKELEPNIKPNPGSSETLDKMDQGIFECIYMHPGLSIMGVYRCYSKLTGHRFGEQHFRYRINSLEKAGYIRTERVIKHWAERQCYLMEGTEPKRRRRRIGNNKADNGDKKDNIL